MAALKSELLSPGMRVGLYGGTFDPPHDGHAHVARTALMRLGLDRVWWLPSPRNPFKAHFPAPMAQRLAAIEALVPEPRQVPSDLERRLGTNRTITIIRAMQTAFPQVRFVWIMGADGLLELHRWRAWREIAARVPFCVVARPEVGLKARLAPAARIMARDRIPEIRAKRLCDKRRGWTYLTETLHPHASRHIRGTSPVTEAAD
jgi:nicotinate-nucleotide adenylyltransferase